MYKVYDSYNVMHVNEYATSEDHEKNKEHNFVTSKNIVYDPCIM